MNNSLFRRVTFALSMFGIIAFVCKPVFAEPSEKPRVAIKIPAIGEGVSKSVHNSLDLPKLLAEMEASLQSTRKFEVLSRNKSMLSAVREEQEFAKSDLAKGNAAQEGMLENADYLVIPTVQDFVFYRSAKPVPNLASKYIRRDSGRLEINAQVLDTSTGAIKTTFYMKSSFATRDEVVNSRGGSPSSVHFTNMAKQVSAQMADQLVDTVFPMQVLNSDNSQVWINRGQDGGLHEGDTLNVYRPGEALIDPDTGENLGSAESFLAKVKVVRVNPKFTIAEISGKEPPNPILKGDILRKP
jgi:Flagellar assembly protein T, C-terminal domain/Curli production assembly/transport component CsgG